jgi:thioredoxin-dependent peroxiredoxin
MVQGDGRLGIEGFQLRHHVGGFFFFRHREQRKRLCRLDCKEFVQLHRNSLPMTHLQVGDLAPEFSGLDQHGIEISMDDFVGKRIVLYFYPKDDTPGCTAEACSFRDGYQDLLDAGFAVVGVSPDPVKKHAKFVEKYDLPFSLIADEDRKVIDAYGVWGRKKFMGREYDGVYRETFVIGTDGRIERILDKVDTKDSAGQILNG